MEKFDPLNGHEIHSTLKELIALQGKKELNAEHFEISPSHVYAIDRVFRQANDARIIVSKLRSEEVDIELLNELNSGLSNTRNEILAFISNGNPGHLDAARQHAMGGITPPLKRLLPIGFDVHPRTEAALESYKAKARRANIQLSAEIRERLGQISEATRRIEQQDQALSDLSAQIESKRTENERIISELREADIERIERQGKEAREAVGKAEKDLSSFLANKGAEVSGSLEDWKVRSHALLVELENKKEDARKIVQSVGDLLTIGTYADRAVTETAKAEKFRNITVGLFVVGLLIIVSNYIIYAASFAVGAELVLAETWQALTARLVTGLAVALPAFYTAKESARHRTNADSAKQRELELSTLGPFIELLPSEQKSAIRERLTDRYFGNKDEPHEFVPPYDAEALVRSLLEAVRRTGGDAT